MIPHVERPFFKSAIYLSSDHGSIPDALMRGFNVVVIVDLEEAGYYPACYPMSSLLPPPNLVNLILNTDRSAFDYMQIEQMYDQAYYNYIASPNLEGHIVNLIASIYKTNKNVLLFAETDVEQQFRPLRILSLFFATQFGINLLPYESLFGPPQNIPLFTPAPEYIYKIIELLFTNNFVSKEEYACVLPPNAVPSPRAISILLSDYNYIFPTMEVALKAACNIIDTYRKQQQTGMKQPVIEFTKALDECRNQQIQQLINNSNVHFGKDVGGSNPQNQY